LNQVDPHQWEDFNLRSAKQLLYPDRTRVKNGCYFRATSV